jgi:hypothetical protein
MPQSGLTRDASDVDGVLVMTAIPKAEENDPVNNFTLLFDIVKTYRDAGDAFELPGKTWDKIRYVPKLGLPSSTKGRGLECSFHSVIPAQAGADLQNVRRGFPPSRE